MSPRQSALSILLGEEDESRLGALGSRRDRALAERLVSGVTKWMGFLDFLLANLLAAFLVFSVDNFKAFKRQKLIHIVDAIHTLINHRCQSAFIGPEHTHPRNVDAGAGQSAAAARMTRERRGMTVIDTCNDAVFVICFVKAARLGRRDL